ncbi:MAG TPA: hypothetical protein VE993_22140 [Stellaceae bacterium]|nr:hypothetical protein [Stellaceae bacterium]
MRDHLHLVPRRCPDSALCRCACPPGRCTADETEGSAYFEAFVLRARRPAQYPALDTPLPRRPQRLGVWAMLMLAVLSWLCLAFAFGRIVHWLVGA